MHVRKGFIDLDVRAKVVSDKIHAPGRAVIKGLELETGSGFGDRFMGVPASAVLSSMKKSGDQLPVDFVVSGDLDNPKFNVAENFMTGLSYAIAETTGRIGSKISAALSLASAPKEQKRSVKE